MSLIIFSGMTMKLDGKVIYTSSSAIADSRNIPVVFLGTIVGKEFEIIGPIGQYLGFKDCFKIFKGQKTFLCLHCFGL